MKRIFISFLVVWIFLLTSIVYAGDALLEKLEIEASSTMDIYSRYVWRGMLMDEDPVIQPGFELSGYG